MITEAVSSGYYILTMEELLHGKAIEMPKSIPSQFKQAEKVRKKDATQGDLF